MMQQGKFNFFMPVDIRFGEGRIVEIGQLAALYGKKAMLITTPWNEAQRPVFEKVAALLEDEGITVVVYDRVCPNPTVDIIDEGSMLARKESVDVLIGVGGGSSLDTAKSISIGATHQGSIWDYIATSPKQPGNNALPTITVGTTAGTGAHITYGAVITNSAMALKSGVVSKAIIPKACIVDPELTYSMPPHLTAITGFDVFTHAFESYINKSNNIMIDHFALEAINIVVDHLPLVQKDGQNKQSRRMMAYADTLAGICITNMSTTLFHAMGMAVGGRFPDVAHGESLAAVYPVILDFSWQQCIERFAAIARIFDPKLNGATDEQAAQSLSDIITEFLERIGARLSLNDFHITEQDCDSLTEAAMMFTDIYAHPRVPDFNQIRELYRIAAG